MFYILIGCYLQNYEMFSNKTNFTTELKKFQAAFATIFSVRHGILVMAAQAKVALTLSTAKAKIQ